MSNEGVEFGGDSRDVSPPVYRYLDRMMSSSSMPVLCQTHYVLWVIASVCPHQCQKQTYAFDVLNTSCIVLWFIQIIDNNVFPYFCVHKEDRTNCALKNSGLNKPE